MITKVKTPAGWLYRLSGSTVVSVLDNGPHNADLIGTAEAVMNAYNGVVERFSSTAAPNEAKAALDRLKPRIAALLKQMQDENRKLSERDARIDAPSGSYDMAWENRFVVGLHEKPLPSRIAAVIDIKSLAKSSALVRHNDLDELEFPHEIVTAVRGRHRLLSAVEMVGLRANHAVKPTLEQPLPSGADEEAVFADAAKRLADLEAERERLTLDARALADLTVMIAVASNQRPDELFHEVAA